MAKIHHATIAMLAKLDATIETLEDGSFRVMSDGVQIALGTDAKDTASKARAIMEDEDFDLEALRAEQEEDDEMVEDEGTEDTGTEDAEGENEGSGSVVKAKYRARYKEIGANDSNGDELALALREAITVVGEKARDTHMSITAMQHIADQNGITEPLKGDNNGHKRMWLGNKLRGKWMRGEAVHVGDVTIEPTPEAKAKAAERFEAERAKAERKAAPRKTAEEKKAARNERAKARRAAKRATKEEPAQAA